MSEIDIILKVWPILVVIGVLVCTTAVGVHRVTQNEARIKEIKKKLKNYMTLENHNKDCKISSLEIKDHFRGALAEFSAKLLLKMDEQQKPIVEAISKNTNAINRLDRRTVHLKDIDAA